MRRRTWLDRSHLTAWLAQIYVSTCQKSTEGSDWLTDKARQAMIGPGSSDLRRRTTTTTMMMKLCNCSVGGKHVCLNQLSSPLAVAPPDRLFWWWWEWCPCLCLFRVWAHSSGLWVLGRLEAQKPSWHRGIAIWKVFGRPESFCA